MTTRLACLASTLVLLVIGPAQAGVVLQPAAVSTDMGEMSPADNVRNQNGLSPGYTSLATDFDAYIAANPPHDGTSASRRWVSSISVTTGNFDFDLGGTFRIKSFALWNMGDDLGFNVIDFDLLADDNPAFSSPASLGTFAADPNTGPFSAVLPEAFTFAPAEASYVRMVINSNHGGATTSFGEAAFEVVPEPASLLLIALGGLALFAGRVRRRYTVAACVVLLAAVLVDPPLSADAAIVQITQSGNQINSLSGDDLVADVTGDGTADITIADQYYQPSLPWNTYVTIDGISFENIGDPSAGAAYWIDGVLTGPVEGLIGETYYLPFSFTDLGFSPSSIDALLEIRVQAHFEEAAQTGTILRRVLFDLDIHGPPTGYSEFVSYPEAQRLNVPEPASALLALLGSLTSLAVRRRK